MTVTPHSGLTNGQQVHVVGTGFTPGLRLVVIECFDLGEATGPRDCDLSQLKYVNASGMGRVDTMLTVHKSIGFPARTCGAPTPCLVSVSVPSQTNHYEMGNQRITFG